MRPKVEKKNTRQGEKNTAIRYVVTQRYLALTAVSNFERKVLEKHVEHNVPDKQWDKKSKTMGSLKFMRGIHLQPACAGANRPAATSVQTSEMTIQQCSDIPTSHCS